MAATLNQTYLALAAAVNTALSTNCVKGKPRWGAPAAATPPLAALTLQSFQVVSERVGQQHREAVVEVALYCANEAGLHGWAETWGAWLQANKSITANGVAVRVEHRPGQRIPNETGMDQEDYAMAWEVGLRWP